MQDGITRVYEQGANGDLTQVHPDFGGAGPRLDGDAAQAVIARATVYGVMPVQQPGVAEARRMLMSVANGGVPFSVEVGPAGPDGPAIADATQHRLGRTGATVVLLSAR